MIVTVVPLATYAAGTYAIGETALADSIVQLKAAIARCTGAAPTIWPSSSVGFNASFDFFDGTTWTDNLYFFSDAGGIRVDHGADLPASYAIWHLPDGAGRKLRGSVTITGGSLRSSVTIDVT
jgi:hypothetical protein